MQPWLIPYQNPILKRLGEEFFKSVPRVPGVYIFRGPQDSILYIGKAKDLRARLASYKRARPHQVSRKVIRMLNLAVRIELQECESEEAALLRENRLLREHKPPFNVVNTAPESYYFIHLETGEGGRLELRLTTDPTPPERGALYGTYKGRGRVRDGYSALLRLLWASHHEGPDRFEFPSQLMRRRPVYQYAITLSGKLAPEEARRWLMLIRRFLNGTSKLLLRELMSALLENAQIPPFMYHFVQADLESLEEFFALGPHRNWRLRRAHGLTTKLIAQDEIDDLIVTFRSRHST